MLLLSSCVAVPVTSPFVQLLLEYQPALGAISIKKQPPHTPPVLEHLNLLH